MVYVFIALGFVLSLLFDVQNVSTYAWYYLLTSSLLAVGLYSSTYGISINDAKAHIRLIITAVTIGVVCKAIIIGTILSLVMQSPFGFILGILVAQIDPLSTASLMNRREISSRAKAIIASWSSFDDPITVILSLATPVLLVSLTGEAWPSIAMQDAGLVGYVVQFALNLIFALLCFLFYRLLSLYAKQSTLNFGPYILYILVVISLAISVQWFLMLGIALIGLFLRPTFGRILDRTVTVALLLAGILLGMLLTHGISLWYGCILGIVTFVSQIIVGFLLTRSLPRHDRIHIAFAQQNGITAIILALLFEIVYPGTIAIVAPAIIVINVLHQVSNIALRKYL